jgi:hypothetical protein
MWRTAHGTDGGTHGGPRHPPLRQWVNCGRMLKIIAAILEHQHDAAELDAARSTRS